MLFYLVSEALIIPNIFYFSGHSSSSLFVAELSCSSKHLIVLTLQNTTFICLYSDNIFILFQFTYDFWSFMCYCLPYKAFFTQLSIQSLPAIYNSLKAHFLFHTSVCIAARLESVMYLCPVFSLKQILSFSPLLTRRLQLFSWSCTWTQKYFVEILNSKHPDLFPSITSFIPF